MRKLIRIFLMIIALGSVGALAYTAYILSSRTLVLPFIGSENQKGSVLELVFSPPSLLSPTKDVEFIDSEAILSSLEKDGKVLPPEVVSGEYSLVVDGGYLRLSALNSEKSDTPVTIKSSTYNKIKKTLFRLPRNITLTPSDIPKSLSVYSIGEPKDQIYDVSFYGLPDSITPSDIRYYVHYDTKAGCDISNWQTYQPLRSFYYGPKYPSGTSISGEITPRTERVAYSSLLPDEVLPDGKDGQRWVKQVKLPYNVDASRICIIAGVGGLYQVVEDRFMEPFTASGRLSESLSPEFDMKSQIEFAFSHDIYADSGALYSAEYMNHRNDAKVEFLKRFDITPNISLKTEDLMLTPDHAILTLPLEEGKDYNISLRDISDIYGRKTSVNTIVNPKSEPFLSLKLNNTKQIYTTKTPIEGKLYALKSDKKQYNLKLCSLSLEDYSKIERMNTNTLRGKNSMIFDILTHGRECRTKEIVLSGSGYVSPFTLDDFFQGEKSPGLYTLYFANSSDIEKYEKFISPIIFSIVDTHLTLKVDASGKMMVLATDILTGKPRQNQVISLTRNISRTYKERWDSSNQRVEKEYIPLTSQAFATGVSIGVTNAGGFAETKIDTLAGLDGYDSNPFYLTFQSWWDYEGRYDSFLVESHGDGHLGYLVSTWNDGITGYNFGMKDSDYSYQSRGKYTSYIHTDRKLYLPGEKVHIHAIIRENKASLTIPTTPFVAILTDPLGREIRRVSVKTNEYGSFSLDYELPKEASLGMYSINLITPDNTEYVENSWTNFQVEVFKNPTFTATVELKSDDLENETVKNLMKVPNNDPYNPWYNDMYIGKFSIGGIVKAKYYNGAEMRNTTFTYRVYRSEYYPDDYWGDCFWGCYWEPPLELYSEGTGSIDGDGYGVMRIPVEYKSFYSDYKYTVEVTIRDPLSGEEVTTPGSLIVKLPSTYKGFSLENPLVFSPKKKILKNTEMLTGDFAPTYGKWEQSLVNKYQYEIYRKDYEEGWVEDIRMGKTRITTSEDVFISSGTILKKDLSMSIPAAKPGEYHMKVRPATPDAPESSISETIFYISGENMSIRDMNLRVIPEKTVYHKDETARVMIQVPFTGSYLLITQEKGGVVQKEYLYLSGNTLMREYKIDDTMIPNSYIGVVALRPGIGVGDSRGYAVGYGEIVTDISEKKSILTITPDKERYKNRDVANIDLTLTDNSGNPLIGEVTVMVVDESLIRLLGNVDLDVMPKFYQKYPFTVRTALTAIGIERGQFLSRKGSNGGGGNKGGDGSEISTRTLFENTAYYHPGIVTDLGGKARVTFTLPDNITNYRIIAIANTKDSHFGVKERTIEIRKDYVLEPKLPMILRNGDTFTAIVSAFNNTNKITAAEIIMTLGTGTGKIEKKAPISLNVGERKKVDFKITLPESWKGSIPYTIQLRESDKILDGVSSNIKIAPLPFLTDIIRDVRVFSGTSFSYALPDLKIADGDKAKSRVSITVADSYASEWKNGLDSLVMYPYGCIEQTIASTLPNRVALSLTGVVPGNFDVQKARDNVANGLAKILRMQHISGGWTYWEGDQNVESHITPYVVRSLVLFRDLSEKIPDEVFTNAVNYIVANESEYQKNMDTYAEAVWTLALLKNENALTWWNKIDTSKLSRHGYLAYLWASQKLGKYSLENEKIFMDKLANSNASDWYWSSRSDQALFVQLLFERNEREKALRYLDPLMRYANFDSFYVSTQEKIQVLLALLGEVRGNQRLKNPETIALRGDTIISDISLTPEKPSNTFDTSREKIGSSYALKRSNGAVPLIVTTRIQDLPKDLSKLPAYGTGGIKVTRTFDLIDESKGLDKNNNFVSVTNIKDFTFQKGKLYRVTLTATIEHKNDEYWYNLAIEDFFPGAWRPINQNFKTESSLMDNVQDNEYWWTYVESKEDRLLVHMNYGWGNTRKYVYYFRPELVGTYLLPPATAYYMYNPDAHAYTEYAQVKVVE